MKYLGIIAILVIVLVGGYALLRGGTPESTSPAQDSSGALSAPGDDSASGERVPALTLKDYDGNDVSLASFSGKALIVNSWAAWCPFCKKELPDFAALQKEFPDIAIVAIDRAEPISTAKRYSDELGVTGKLVLLLDPSDSFYKAIGGFTMPETIFVDKNGAIVFHKRGPMSLDEMRQKISELQLVN